MEFLSGFGGCVFKVNAEFLKTTQIVLTGTFEQAATTKQHTNEIC